MRVGGWVGGKERGEGGREVESYSEAEERGSHVELEEREF